MHSESDFVAHLLELLHPVGGVTAKRMFGGYGLFRDGLMFGLVADGVLYLKADEDNRAEFTDIGLPAFQYETRDGRVSVMSYHQCPEDALESPIVMTRWARSAIAAAHRQASRPQKSRRRPKD